MKKNLNVSSTVVSRMMAELLLREQLPDVGKTVVKAFVDELYGKATILSVGQLLAEAFALTTSYVVEA